MPKWRMKTLPLREWATLQEHFGKLQLAQGGPEDLAMFVTGRASERESPIYITGPGISAIEALSPGGWEDSDGPSGTDVCLLVGTANSWDYFGIGKTL